MIRQLLGVISEFGKASLVAKLRGARERQKRATSKWRDAKASPSCGQRWRRWRVSCVAAGQSQRSGAIAAELAAGGHPASSGKPFEASVVARMLRG
jgi:hypothetical protein